MPRHHRASSYLSPSPGISTRRINDPIPSLACEGISKSEVSRICSELDAVVDSFLGRPLDGGPYPDWWMR